jgi:hypothetical protein
MKSAALSSSCSYRQFLSAGAHSILTSQRSCKIYAVVTLLLQCCHTVVVTLL